MTACFNDAHSALVPCKITDHVQVTRYYVPFGINDAKGRAVGCRVGISSSVRTERDGNDGGCWVCKPEDLGLLFCADVHVCRDEKAFGGSSACKWFKTVEEAESFVEAAVERCRKANAKKFSAK